jgi:hypothetical protein
MPPLRKNPEVFVSWAASEGSPELSPEADDFQELEASLLSRIEIGHKTKVYFPEWMSTKEALQWAREQEQENNRGDYLNIGNLEVALATNQPRSSRLASIIKGLKN